MVNKIEIPANLNKNIGFLVGETFIRKYPKVQMYVRKTKSKKIPYLFHADLYTVGKVLTSDGVKLIYKYVLANKILPSRCVSDRVEYHVSSEMIILGFLDLESCVTFANFYHGVYQSNNTSYIYDYQYTEPETLLKIGKAVRNTMVLRHSELKGYMKYKRHISVRTNEILTAISHNAVGVFCDNYQQYLTA